MAIADVIQKVRERLGNAAANRADHGELMPVPTQADHDLASIDDLHAAVVVRLRTYQRAGQGRDAASIREALHSYVDAVAEFVDHARD